MQHYKICFGRSISLFNSASRSSNFTSSFQLVRTRSSFTRFILNPLQYLRALVPRNTPPSTLPALPPRSLNYRVLLASRAAIERADTAAERAAALKTSLKPPSPPSVTSPQNQSSVPTPSSSSSPDPSQEPASASNVPQAVRPGHSKSALMKSQLSSITSPTQRGTVQSLIKRSPTPPLRELRVPPPEADADTSLLREFFDDPKTWPAWSVKSGRPWRVEELRLKSSADLHRLWYVLLKERNMLMTMQAEYDRLLHHMPNPERFEKVEESMENLLQVVMERNRAVQLLETGKHGEPEPTWNYDWLGRPVFGWTSEHAEPRHANAMVLARKRLMGAWVTPYLRREREQRLERMQERWRAWKRAAEKKEPAPDAGSRQHARFVRQAIYK